MLTRDAQTQMRKALTVAGRLPMMMRRQSGHSQRSGTRARGHAVADMTKPLGVKPGFEGGNVCPQHHGGFASVLHLEHPFDPLRRQQTPPICVKLSFCCMVAPVRDLPRPS